MVGEHTVTFPYLLLVAARVPTAVGIVVGIVRATPVTHAQAEPFLGLEELACIPAPTEGRCVPLGRVLRQILDRNVLVGVATMGGLIAGRCPPSTLLLFVQGPSSLYEFADLVSLLLHLSEIKLKCCHCSAAFWPAGPARRHRGNRRDRPFQPSVG